MLSPVEALPWGSRSISRTRRPASASDAAKFIAVVVLPTPPFWLAIAMMCEIVASFSSSADHSAFVGRIWRSARIMPSGSVRLGIRWTVMCHFAWASVNSSSTLRPFWNRHRPFDERSGWAHDSNFGKGARARAVMSPAHDAATCSMRLLTIRTCVLVSRAASRRKLAFLESASIRVTGLSTHMARMRPGKPAPEPRSMILTTGGTRGTSCRLSAMWRDQRSSRSAGATRLMRVFQRTSIAVNRSRRSWSDGESPSRT